MPNGPPSRLPPFRFDDGVIDLLTASVAEHHGAVILHYGADFERIAAVTGQPHTWIAPRGSIN